MGVQEESMGVEEEFV